MGTDNFPGAGLGNIDAARKCYAITPSDSVELPFIPRGIYVGGAGNIAVKLLDDDNAVTLVGCLAGSILPIRPKNVMATNTTATNLVALY